MERCTASVLGGGGSRGALQVGAMRALLEAGIAPDLLVGTSIGAVNAAGLALWGVDLDGIDALERTWQEISGVQLLDSRVSQLILRAMVGRPSDRSKRKVEEFFVSQGFTHGLRFNQITWVRLALISADIETGEPVIYGQDTSQSILEGLMASIAIPPWFLPYQKENQIMVDGGALSNLPIEPALRLGATEIIALDLDDNSKSPKENLSLAQYIDKYLNAVNRRHVCLETALAEARGVPVHCIDFRGLDPTPVWDFSNNQALIKYGYEKACTKIEEWQHEAAQPVYAISRRDVIEKQPVYKEHYSIKSIL